MRFQSSIKHVINHRCEFVHKESRFSIRGGATEETTSLYQGRGITEETMDLYQKRGATKETRSLYRGGGRG